MRHLPMPEDSGDNVILKQCSRPGWVAYGHRWLTAAAAYRAAGGDPWVVTIADFSDVEKAALYNLYDTRRSSGVMKRLRRPKGGYASCPMCGSSGGGSLDHALPRSIFPEFSIVRENLVPACSICNTDEKGAEYQGKFIHERLIHPYYDQWASAPIWEVAFGEDLDAVVFTAVPSSILTPGQWSTVAYHLTVVLGSEWEESSRRFWGTLGLKIQDRLGNAPTAAETRLELEHRLRDETFDKGVNGWSSALLRGALRDSRVPVYLSEQVRALPASY